MIAARPRRNRHSNTLRELVAETHLRPEQLIFPLFLIDQPRGSEPILSLPGQSRLSEDETFKTIERALSLDVRSFALFPRVDEPLKDSQAKYSYSQDNYLLKRIEGIKKRFPSALVVTDVAMDPYSSDGHDGIYQNGKILNDETLPILGLMAIAQAAAGADIVAPSDMMDGRVGYIRHALDERGFSDVGIMSYTAKYASSFYGPFRDALNSAPKAGDKKTYQMDPRNRTEALREAYLDFEEGADQIMVKPALAYLDIISDLKKNISLPIAAYNVSGEYAMVKAAAEKGWLDGEKAMVEMLTSIHRAGADIILTYFALEYAEYFRKK